MVAPQEIVVIVRLAKQAHVRPALTAESRATMLRQPITLPSRLTPMYRLQRRQLVMKKFLTERFLQADRFTAAARLTAHCQRTKLRF